MWQQHLRQAESVARRICARNFAYHRHREDAIQEARIALWRCSLSFDVAKAPDLWAYASVRVRGAVWDFLRSAHAVQRPGKRYGVEPEFCSLDEVLHPLIEPNEAVILPSMYARIEALPRHWQRAIYLRFWEGRGYEEVDLRIGMRPDCSRQAVRKALERLR